MKKKIPYLLICILSLGSFLTCAQQNIKDSLIDELETAIKACPEPCNSDTLKINTLNLLSRQCSNAGNYDQALKYANEVIAIINKINNSKSAGMRWMKSLADAYINIGVIQEHQGQFAKGLLWYTKSIKIYEDLCGSNKSGIDKKCRKGLAACYNNIGRIHSEQNNSKEALIWFNKSLHIMEEINDKEGMANAYGNTGLIHSYLGNVAFDRKDIKAMEKEYLEAFNCYSKTLKLEQEINDTRGMVTSSSNIGFLLTDVFEKDSTAVVLIDKKNVSGFALLDSAFACQTRGYILANKISDKPGMLYCLNGIGRIYLKKKQFNSAFKEFQNSLKLATEIGEAMVLEDALRGSYESLKGLGKHKEALKYYEKCNSLHDSIQNEGNQKKSLSQHYAYEYENKMKLLQSEQEKQTAVAAAESRKQKIIIWSVVGGLLLLIVFTLFVYGSNRQKQKLNKELEQLSIVASESDNGILICGPKGEIEWCNPGLTRLLGYTFEEMKKRSSNIEGLSSNPDIKLLIHQSIENKKATTYEVLNITKDGNEKWTQSTLTPILNEEGNIKKLVIIDTDISERKKIEQKLSEQNQGLEQSHRDISILSEIGKEITSSLSIEKIVEKAYENVNKLMEATVFCIGIYNPQKHSVDFPGFIEKGKKFDSSYDLNDDTRLPVLCFKNHQEILINDLQKDFGKYIPYIPDPIAGEHPESLIYLPMYYNDKVIGVINVESFHKNAYTSYHLNLLKNLAVYVAIAIENAQLYQNLEEKVEERTAELVKGKQEIEKTYNNIQILSEIGQEITSTLNLEKVLDTVYKKVNSLMDATEFGIGIYNPEKKSIDFSYYYYESKRMEGDLDTWVSMEDKNRLSVWCAVNKKTVFINDIQKEYTNYISNLDSYKGEGKLLLESLICLPLVVEEKLVGLISVQSPKKNTYTQNHLEILQTLASYVAIALDNARLYDNLVKGKEEIEKTYNNIKVLSEIGQQLTSTLNFEDLFNKLHENINRLLDAKTFGIRIYHPESNSVEIKYEYDKGVRQESFSFSMDNDNNYTVWCIKNKKDIFLNDNIKEHKKYVNEIVVVLGEMTQSLMFCPMIIKDKVIGVITVQSYEKNSYTKQQLDILKTLANYAAIAFDNARLYDNLVKGKEEIEKTYTNIQVLSEIGQQLTSTLNFEDIFSKLHENVNRLMDGEVFGIRIYHPENNTIVTQYEYEKGERQEAITFSTDNEDNLSVWCIKNKKEIYMNDNLNEYKKYVKNIVLLGGEMPHSLMFCPMILKDKVIGVITVQSYQKNSYTKQHLDVLRTLANYTAIAFDNALLYDNMEGEVKVRTTEIEKQKTLVEDKNLKITDSINYALRIQQAILPTQQMISTILPNSFIFFKPKDIVSGDFYWAHHIPSAKEDGVTKGEVLFAAVDCTGHGVPGAFMSIMGYNLLEQIVKENKIYEPAQILTELSKLVVNSLKQTEEIGSIREGMDIALCKINYKKMELEYSGAHNSLVLIRNGELTETKANQRSIGISITSKIAFQNHKIKLKKGDTFYIFSDGFADQFGEKSNQKFFYNPFRELLLDIHKLSMEKQEKKLEKVISTWKGSREQTDDMLVIGVRV